MSWGSQALGRRLGLGVQVRDNGGRLWRRLWSGKKWMDSRDILVALGTWEGHTEVKT